MQMTRRERDLATQLSLRELQVALLELEVKVLKHEMRQMKLIADQIHLSAQSMVHQLQMRFRPRVY